MKFKRLTMKDKFDMNILKGKIVMAFTNPLDVLLDDYNPEIHRKENYKYFTENFTGEGIHSYYVFDTPEEFMNKWKEIYNLPNGMWYWCLNDGQCFCSGAVDPGDIEIFEDYFGLSE